MRRLRSAEAGLEAFPVEPDSDSTETSETPGHADHAANGLPAWRRIEEFWEMHALKQRLRDDVYGERPLQDLWDDE